MKQYQKIKYATVASCAALFTGCANSPSGPSCQNSNPFKQIFASDDPCSNNSRNIDIAVGVIGGLILGDAVGKGKSDSLAAGALVGGLLGGFIGADMDRKRCELSKVAKQYQLDIQFSPIGANGEVIVQQAAQTSPTGKSEPVSNPIGTALTVRDKGGAVGHFETGSDELTPKDGLNNSSLDAVNSRHFQMAESGNPKLQFHAFSKAFRLFFASFEAFSPFAGAFIPAPASVCCAPSTNWTAQTA